MNEQQPQQLTPDQQKQVKKAKRTLWFGLILIVVVGLVIAVYFVFINPIEGDNGATNVNTIINENVNSISNTNMEDCKKYFDGCNTCFREDDGRATCTELACTPEELKPYKCLDDDSTSVNTNTDINIAIEDEIVKKCFVPEDSPCVCEAIGCCDPKNKGVVYDWQTNSCRETALRDHKPPFNSITECESLCLDVKSKDFGGGYIAIEDKIYLNQQLIEGANPETFEIISIHYSCDENYIYFNYLPLKDVDPETFQILQYPYSEDKNYVYKRGILFKDKNEADYRILNDNYSKDNYGVYHFDEPIHGADPATFVVADHNYAKDNEKVYYYGEVIENADVISFEVLKFGYAKDKNYVYKDGREKPQMDAATFFVINTYYATDKNYVYHYGEILDGYQYSDGEIQKVDY